MTDAPALRGFGALAAASALFGVSAVFVRVATEQMAAPQVAWCRFAGILAIMLVVTRGRGLAAPGDTRRWLVVRGLLGGAANVCFYVGIERAGPGLAMVLHSTYPVWTALFAVLVLHDRFTGRIALALGVNLVGVLLVLGDRGGGGSRVVSGVLFALAGGVLAGASVTTVSFLRRAQSATLITTWFMVVASVVTSPALATGMPPPTWRLGWALAGVVATGGAGQWLLHHGLGFTTATSGSLAAATSVVAAAVLGAVMLGEPVGLRLVGAGVLMVIAVALAAPRHAAA